MLYIVNKKIGNTIHQFGVEGDTLHQCLMNAKKLSFDDVEECGICGNKKLTLTAYVAQEKFDYVRIFCEECGGGINISNQLNDPSIVYLQQKKDSKELRWEVFNKKED